jgi:hypothetical protein
MKIGHPVLWWTEIWYPTPKLLQKVSKIIFFETIRRLGWSFTCAVRNLCNNLHNLTSFTSQSKPIFQFQAIIEQFTQTYLHNLKQAKSTGLDNMPARLMKDSADTITGPVTTVIFLTCLCLLINFQVNGNQHVYRLYIVPLLKSGKPEKIDNYRPISILPITSKILERAVHKQLYSFLTSNNLLSPYQFGFRKQHSTETASIFLSQYFIPYGPIWTTGD